MHSPFISLSIYVLVFRNATPQPIMESSDDPSLSLTQKENLRGKKIKYNFWDQQGLPVQNGWFGGQGRKTSPIVLSTLYVADEGQTVARDTSCKYPIFC